MSTTIGDPTVRVSPVARLARLLLRATRPFVISRAKVPAQLEPLPVPYQRHDKALVSLVQ